jgi:PilZ domain
MERRQYERNDLRFFARVYNRKLGRLIGYLVNITPMGVMVVSEKPIDPGASVGLRIELPESIADTPHLDLDAKCVWSRMDSESTFFELGFKLREIRDDQAHSIEQIVNRYGL